MVFKVLGVPCPSKDVLLKKLEQAVLNSETKGYHTRGMDFSKLQKSGVSKILLKGESYSAPPNMKKVKMHERWRFGNSTEYLDASCLAYDFNGKIIATVDYSNQEAFKFKERGNGRGYGSYTTFGRPAIDHSGDQIDHVARSGEHTIDIDVQSLPSHVAALYFTVSSWTTTLKDIIQPSVHLVGDEDIELCSYELEQTDTGENTAVIMCKLFRESKGSRRWEMKAIGHIGLGRATNGHVNGHSCPYGPIRNDIKQKDL
jgi:stress response protein SCP2